MIVKKPSYKFHRIFTKANSFSYILNIERTHRRLRRPGEKRLQLNIAYFLLPKNQVAFLYDDFTFRQGLEKMHRQSHAAIPVISRSGQYIGTVSEGDFLWHLIDTNPDAVTVHSMRDMESLYVRDILKKDSYPPVRITVTMDELLHSAMLQNFIPVVDDLDNFIGIVTRKDIIRYFTEHKCAEKPLQKIV